MNNSKWDKGYQDGLKQVKILQPTKSELYSMIYARICFKLNRNLTEYEEGFIQALKDCLKSAVRFVGEGK